MISTTTTNAVVVVEAGETVVLSTSAPVVAQIAVVEEVAHVINTAGQQGPRGPAGADGADGQDGTSNTPDYPTDVAISGHLVVAVSDDGKLVPADSTDPSMIGRIVGLTDSAHMAGSEFAPRVAGVLTLSGWTFTPGARILVGANGALTQTLPVGAVFSQTVGTALSATSIIINIEPPITFS